MKRISMFIGLLLACFAFAEGDLDAQYLLTPRDSKSLSEAEKKVWIRATCNIGTRDFEWRGCKFDQLGGRSYLFQSTRDSTYFAPATVVTGSFTGVGRQEALVTYVVQERDCCDTVDVLLRYQQGQYRPVRLFVRSASAGCLRVRLASNRDALGCSRQYDNRYQNNSYASITTNTYFNAEKSSYTALEAPGYPPYCPTEKIFDGSFQNTAPFRRIDLRAWGKTDANQDGVQDIVVVIGERRWKALTPEEACKEDAPLTTVRVTLIATPEGLRPTEASRLILKRINAEYQWRR